MEGTNGSGIDITNNGTELKVSANIVSGETGIDAKNYGAGKATITTTGLVQGTSGNGIYALHSGADPLTDLTISATSVEGDSYGIHAVAGGRNVKITADTATGANGEGIRVEHTGTGTSKITATGLVQGAGGNGIQFNTSGTDATISVSDVAGGGYGILGIHNGTGKQTITATGTVEGTNGNGILAFNSGGTDLKISATTVTGGGGIITSNNGSGQTTITATDVHGTEGFGYGIDASNGANTTNLTISAASVESVKAGIDASNFGSGKTTITVSGPVTGTNLHGIRFNTGGTTATISVSDVTGGGNGIVGTHNGSGKLSVTASGAVAGGSGYGLSTSTNAGGLTEITLNAGASASSTSGKAIFNDAGDSTTTVHAGASVSGEIRLGDGSDDLIFDGGDFSAVSIFDGGDDTGTADGFIDTLTFQNVTGAVSGSTVINWEEIFIGTLSTISFTDNALTAGKLNLAESGQLTMDTGAAEAFALQGDLEFATGGGLFLEIFDDILFDTFDVAGDVKVKNPSEIAFDLTGTTFAEFTVPVLTSNSFSSFSKLQFSFIGLDPLFDALVTEDSGTLSFNLSLKPAPFAGLAGAAVPSGATAVPEPSSVAVFGTGLLGLFGLSRLWRRKKGAKAARIHSPQEDRRQAA